jgi:hypothetical protein
MKVDSGQADDWDEGWINCHSWVKIVGEKHHCEEQTLRHSRKHAKDFGNSVLYWDDEGAWKWIDYE